MYVLRDALQFGHDLDSAIKILTDAKRTVHIHVGVGSKIDDQFRGVENKNRSAFRSSILLSDFVRTMIKTLPTLVIPIHKWTESCIGISLASHLKTNVWEAFLKKTMAQLHGKHWRGQ
jgi:hypothetical protein